MLILTFLKELIIFIKYNKTTAYTIFVDLISMICFFQFK